MFREGVNVHFAELFKKELNIPVATVGSLTLEMAERDHCLKQSGYSCCKRAFMADPNCVNKARAASRINSTLCALQYLYPPHTLISFAVRCAVNPLNGRKQNCKHAGAYEKKKVVVIGGGPAVWKQAGRRQKEVMKWYCLKKTLNLAAICALLPAAPFKEDMKKYLDWAIRTTMNTPNVTVRLSTEATPEAVTAENPDTLLIAVGSMPIVDIPRIKKRTFLGWDVISAARKSVTV